MDDDGTQRARGVIVASVYNRVIRKEDGQAACLAPRVGLFDFVRGGEEMVCVEGHSTEVESMGRALAKDREGGAATTEEDGGGGGSEYLSLQYYVRNDSANTTGGDAPTNYTLRSVMPFPHGQKMVSQDWSAAAPNPYSSRHPDRRMPFASGISRRERYGTKLSHPRDVPASRVPSPYRAMIVC